MSGELEVDIFEFQEGDEIVGDFTGDSDGEMLECSIQEIQSINSITRVQMTVFDIFKEMVLQHKIHSWNFE